jgi:hypothetical protein
VDIVFHLDGHLTYKRIVGFFCIVVWHLIDLSYIFRDVSDLQLIHFSWFTLIILEFTLVKNYEHSGSHDYTVKFSRVFNI